MNIARHGDLEEIIRKQCAADGTPLPESVANRPELLPGLQLFWDAFAELRRGQGLNQIPLRDVMWYCERFEIFGEQRDRLKEHVFMLDDECLEHFEQQRNANTKRK